MDSFEKKLAEPQKLIVFYSYGSLLFLLLCLLVVAILFSSQFVSKERDRAELLKIQLKKNFQFESQAIAEEISTRSFESVRFRIANIAQSVGGTDFNLSVFDDDGHCTFSANNKVESDTCNALMPLDDFDVTTKKRDYDSEIKFDLKSQKYKYFSPIYLGPTLMGYVFATMDDPYGFFRGNVWHLILETIIPIFAVIMSLWIIWYLLLKRFILRPYLTSIIATSQRAATAVLARQVSHDIRSPIAALKAVKESSSEFLSSEQNKLLKASIDRITDIANTILPKTQINQVSHTNENLFLWSLIDQIVSEKRVQYRDLRDVSIDFSFEGSVITLNAVSNQVEFMRALSNIIDNAVEAKIENKALSIVLSLQTLGNQIYLSVRDNGKGIPKTYIDKVFNEGFTADKPNGSGLGLHQVRKSVEQWGGNIQIESQVGEGTKISIQLKKAQQPKWLIETLHIRDHDKIILLDDEEYFHQVIKDKFSEHTISTTYFKLIPEFKEYIQQANLKNPIYFIDHDLKQGVQGIDLIRELNIQDNAILLTGNYDDKELQKKSIEYGVRILPKPLLHTVPIS